MSSNRLITRRKTRQIMVGDVAVGGDAPISVQSMTNTLTSDVEATVAQIERIQKAGADIVRVSVPTIEEADAFGAIRKRVSVPLVADIHFDHKIALRVADMGVDCLRINPGNIGREKLSGETFYIRGNADENSTSDSGLFISSEKNSCQVPVFIISSTLSTFFK